MINFRGFGFYISDGFGVGRSAKSETFGNEPLAEEELFEIRRFEVWGFKLYF